MTVAATIESVALLPSKAPGPGRAPAPPIVTHDGSARRHVLLDELGADLGNAFEDSSKLPQKDAEARRLERLDLACSFERGVSNRALAFERRFDAALDARLRAKVRHRHAPCLSETMRARRSLIELSRVPREIEVDDVARDLKIEAHAARVRRQEHARVLRCAEVVEQRRPSLRRNATVQHRVANSERVEAFGGELQHLGPLREHEDLVRSLSRNFEDEGLELVELRRGSRRTLWIAKLERVAGLSCFDEQHHEAILLLLRERLAIGRGEQHGRFGAVVLFERALLRRERCVPRLLRQRRKLRQNFLLSTSQHDARDPFAQRRQVLVADDFPLLVLTESRRDTVMRTSSRMPIDHRPKMMFASSCASSAIDRRGVDLVQREIAASRC